MTRRVLMANVSGGRVRGRPRLGWMDGVKMALGRRRITVEAAGQWAKDRKERGETPLHDAVGVNCKKGPTTKSQGTGAWYMGQGGCVG